ncbi:IclR family transcriptional regulator [Pigmentiphaga soli]|uniref:IclR family transcriptional regulator n=1 Tax=Pigmentiphaga soli TaxID=1007095 RepID=UPI0031EAFA5B
MSLPESPASSSLGKALELLDLFSLTSPLVRIDDVIARFGFPRSTAYRYLKELCDAGLLAPASGGAYSLGPRVIEFERLLELTDPLYRAGQQVLQEIGDPGAVYLLHNLYRDKVLCIYKQGPDVIEYEGRRITVRRARGLPFPLFQGAGSLALLPWLSPHRIRQTYLRNAAEIASSGLGDDWEAFRRVLAAIRRKGYSTSQGTITPFLGGIAVPVLLPEDRKLVGSLAWTVAAGAMTEERVESCAEHLTRAAQAIAREYVKVAADM